MIDPLRPWQTLFDAATAGTYTLPATLVEQRAAIDRLDAELTTLRDTRPDPATGERDAIDGTKLAATNSTPLPSASTLRQARQAAADADDQLGVLGRARDELAQELAAQIVDLGPQVIAEHLRPVHDGIVTQFTNASAVLPAQPTSDALLQASASIRQTWADLEAAASNYHKVRDAAGKLNRPARLAEDITAEFALMSNLREVWPDWRVGRPPPWSDNDPRRTLLILVRLGAKLWLPTAAEQYNAWHEAHGAALETARQNRADLQAYGGVYQ